MAAVMRFGKTHASYEIVKEAGMKRVLVCSAKADVRTAWREDINHVHFYKDFVFFETSQKSHSGYDVTYCKGKAKPADMAIQAQKEFKPTINLKEAAKIGLKVPEDLLKGADVIK